MLGLDKLSDLHARIIRAFDEIERLGKAVAELKGSFRELETRIRVLEDKANLDAALREQQWQAFVDRTGLAAELAVTRAAGQFEAG